MKRIVLTVLCCFLLFLSACQPAPAAAETSAAAATPVATATPVPTPSPTPVPTPTPTPAPTQVTLMAVGDLMCLRVQINAAAKGGSYNFDYCFAEVKDILSSADLTIGNLETLIAEGYPYTYNPPDEEEATPPTTEDSVPDESSSDGRALTVGGNSAGIGWEQSGGTPSMPQLRNAPLINGPETYLSAVVDAGFDVLTNANNHIYDHGADGICKTLEQLEAYGMAHTVAYAQPEDKQPLIVDVQGVKVGVIAYTDLINHHAGRDSNLIDLYDEDAVAADIAAAKAAGADFTIVYMHWGKENTHAVTARQKEVAQQLADAGADLILGAHPHCVQPFDLIETERGSVPVIYSMGNFASGMPRDINHDGMILKFTLEKDNVTGETTLQTLSYIPTLCTTTSAGKYTILPATEEFIAGSDYASALEASRERTLAVLGEDVAKPE